MKQYLEAGRLTAVRGLKGELRFDCWCDTPEFLAGIKKLFLKPDGSGELIVKQYRHTIPTVIFEGYESRESAAFLVGNTVYFDRNEIALPEGVFYNDDLIGLEVYDYETGEKLGLLKEIILAGSRQIYRIEGEKSYLIPNVPEFIKSRSTENGIGVKLIEGLETD